MKNAVEKSFNWGNFLKRLEQICPVYEADLSVGTEIKELPSLLEFPQGARISEFVARLEELMGRMNSTSYGPTEPHLWPVGKIPPTLERTAGRRAIGKPARTPMMICSIF